MTSYFFTVKKYNKTGRVSSENLEDVKTEAELLGLEYSVEEIQN